MTVKTRITMLIAGAGFIASLLFSVVVFFELLEQPFSLMDTVLQEEADRTTRIIIENQAGEASIDSLADKMHPYWIRIHEQGSNKILYQSDIAKAVRLSPLSVGDGAIVKAAVPGGLLDFAQNSGREVAFRVKTFSFIADDKTYTTQIARPLGKLEGEIQDMVFGIIAGLIFSTLILIAISRFVAGRILQPVGKMKDLALAISEKNLEQRLPAGKGHDEFSELACTINTMLDRLQYSFVKQRELLFDTAHELKTPLATMRLAVDEIFAADGEKSLPSEEENLLRLKNQVLRMEKLVRDLLNLSALETLTGIDYRTVDLKELLSMLLAEYQFLADSADVKMDIRLPERLTLRGDSKKLNRAFSNIIDNALKYNLKGGRIEASADKFATGLTITIANTGPGIPEAEIPKVFDQFYRVEKSRSSNFGGSGLGLTIAKRIVELHGGQIKIESQVEKWTRVDVFLPLDEG
ncbi:MAG: sensor histidine kinase [Syntrophales bacterium]